MLKLILRNFVLKIFLYTLLAYETNCFILFHLDFILLEQLFTKYWNYI